MKYGNYGFPETPSVGGTVKIRSNDKENGPTVEARYLAHPTELMQENGIGE